MGLEVFERIRQIPAFSSLEREGMEQIASGGRITKLAAGEYCFKAGQPADWLMVLIYGQIQITQQEQGQERVMVTYQAPDFFGDIPILLGQPNYFANARALTECKVYRLHVDSFWQILGRYPEATRQFMQAAAQRMNRLQAFSSERQRLSAVSTLAAGLAHELNNPASAALRASQRLGESVVEVQRTSAELARYLPPAQYQELLELLDSWLWEGELTVLTPLRRSDLEEEVATWLEHNGLAEAWEMAEAIVEAGLETPDLEVWKSKVPPECFVGSLRWLAASARAASGVCTTSRSAARISSLVDTMRGYAYLDQAPVQEVNLNEALDSTLRVLNYETGGLEIVRDYATDLPSVTGYGSELGSVWTTLIENALQALGGQGRLELRTRQEHEQVLVEVTDSGPGIALEIQPRIFDPFFTTREVGEGRGLGLSLAYQTVVERHRGDLQFTSRPGETRFQVRLPIHPSTPLPALGEGTPQGVI